MEHVVERLRASAEQDQSEQFNEGVQAGRTWAERDATAKQLRLLETNRDPVHDWYFESGLGGVEQAYGSGELFYFMISGDDYKDRGDAESFWRDEALSHFDTDDYRNCMSDDAFVNGFAHGAIEVWEEVKDQL